MNAAGRLVVDHAARPNVADGEFFWNYIMSINMRSSGMRAIQSEFRQKSRPHLKTRNDHPISRRNSLSVTPSRQLTKPQSRLV
jgi:hypothetical protein